MYFSYVLENDSGNIYIGQTNNIPARLIRHNNNQVKSTKYKGPWKIIHSKNFATRQESIQYETYLKSLKNPKYIKAVIIER